MKRPKVIGRFFDEEYQAALANAGSFYTPPATEFMDLTTLYALRTKLLDLIAYWDNQIVSNTAWEAVENSRAIADLQREKLRLVDEYIAQKQEGGAVLPTENPTTEPKKSWLPIILIGVVALYFFNKKKRAA